MNPLKKLAGQTVIYGVSTIVGRLLNYLLVPLYTDVFKEGEYGIVTDFYAYVAFFNVLYLFGLETTFFRLANKPSADRKLVYNQIQTLVVVNAFVITGLLVIFASSIVEILGYPGQEIYIYILASVMMIDAVVAIPFARLRLEGKAKRFAITKIINIVVVILLNLFFIVWCPILLADGFSGFLLTFYDESVGVGYVFISNLIANALYLLLLADLLFKTKPTIATNSLKSVFAYATPIMFLGLAGVTNEMLSRAMLKYRLPDGYYEGMTSLDALGVFGACYKLSVFMVLAIQAFKYAAEPFFFKGAENKESPALFAKVMNGFIVFASLLLLAVVANLDFIAGIFLRSDVYLKALPTVPWLLLGGLFLGVYYNLSVWFKLTDRTMYGAYISGAGALMTIVLNWLFIPAYGYMASAVITSAIYFFMSGASYLIGQKFYTVPYQIGRGLAYIGAIFGVAMMLYYYHPEDGLMSFMMQNTVVLIVLLLILKIEKVNISKLIRKRS
ncbi:MAG: polysaccharide biosynthesis C-terminal domain-containing protein [Bacteroidota bacterium]